MTTNDSPLKTIYYGSFWLDHSQYAKKGVLQYTASHGDVHRPAVWSHRYCERDVNQ